MLVRSTWRLLGLAHRLATVWLTRRRGFTQELGELAKMASVENRTSKKRKAVWKQRQYGYGGSTVQLVPGWT